MFLVLFSVATFGVWVAPMQRLNIGLKVSVDDERHLFQSLMVFKLNIVPFFGSSILTPSYSLQYYWCLFRDS